MPNKKYWKDSIADYLCQIWCIQNKKEMLKWMEAHNIECLLDLMKYGHTHHVAMDNARKEFWEYSTTKHHNKEV